MRTEPPEPHSDLEEGRRRAQEIFGQDALCLAHGSKISSGPEFFSSSIPEPMNPGGPGGWESGGGSDIAGEARQVGQQRAS